MQNEFDDHIKKQVDGFKLPPSAQVWDLVEAQLPEKKRRRFIYWWLPLGILLIGFGVYEYIGNGINYKTITESKIAIQINKKDKIDSINDLVKTNIPNKTVSRSTNKISKANKIDSINNLVKTNIPNKTFNHSIDKIDKKTIYTSSKIFTSNKDKKDDKIINNNKEKEIVLNDGTEINNEKALFQNKLNIKNKSPKEIVTDNKKNAIKNESNIGKEIVDSQTINKPADSLTIKLAGNELEKINKDSGLVRPKMVAVKTKSTEVEWELIAALGSANTVGNFLSSNSNVQDFSSPNNSATSPGNTATVATLSTPTSGLSLGIDLQRTKQITKHLSWSIGLGYRYLSNHQASGAQVDSSASVGGRISNNFSQAITAGNDNVSNYYKYGNSINHDNYIHLLNISFGLKYNLNKAFSLKGGIGLGYKINSKWLQPDISQSVLFYSNKLTNKWNIGTQIGFDWQFAKSFSIGCFYNYSFSKASLANVQQNLHWQNLGATFSIKLPQKK